jgi:X-X-X-Leu-X-X-Gly heptad repeat protein
MKSPDRLSRRCRSVLQILKRVAVVLLAVTFMITYVPPLVQAERGNKPIMIPTDGTAKREVIYGKLDAVGQVEQLYVINHFQPAEPKTIVDYGDYDKVVQLTGDQPLIYENGKVSTECAKGHYYYQGNLRTRELPWSIIISYRLDDLMQLPKDLSGANGRLVIELAVRENKDVDGGFFNHYALQVTIPVDPGCARVVSASDNLMLAYAGSTQQFSSIVLPGQETTMRVELDVEDFHMGQMTFAGIPLSLTIDLSMYEDEFAPLDDLSEGIAAFAEGSDRLRTGYGELMGAFDELRGGSYELVHGGQQLAAGVNQLKSGVNQYTSGVSQYVDGARKASSGYSQFDKGLSEMHAGVKTLNNEGKTLLSASSSIRDALIELASKLPPPDQIAAQIPSFSEADLAQLDQLVDGSEQFRDGLHAIGKSDGGMYQLWQGLVTLNGSLATAKQAADQIPVPQVSSFEELLALYEGITITGDPEKVTAYYTMMTRIVAGYAASYGLLQATLTGLTDQEMGVPALVSGAHQLYDGLRQLDSAYYGATNSDGSHSPGIHDAIVMIRDRIRDMADSAGTSLGDVMEQYSQLYYGIQALRNGYAGVYDAQGNPVPDASGNRQVGFHQGLTLYMTDGVGGLLSGFEGSAGKPGLIEGSASIKQGLSTLASQGSTLQNAGSTISQGISRTSSGINTYVDGVNRFQSGLGEYQDQGMNPFKEGIIEFDEGAQKMMEETKDLREKFMTAMQEKLDELSGEEYEIRSYASDKNKDVASVQFVIMTEEVPPAKK